MLDRRVCVALMIAAAAGGGCAEDAERRDADGDAASERDGAHPDDLDSGAPGRRLGGWDGDYWCSGRLANAGGSCHGMLVNEGSTWKLRLSGARFEWSRGGEDDPTYGCDGQWSGDAFTCQIAWSGTLRLCSDDVRLHAEPDGTLIVSIGRYEHAVQCAR